MSESKFPPLPQSVLPLSEGQAAVETFTPATVEAFVVSLSTDAPTRLP